MFVIRVFMATGKRYERKAKTAKQAEQEASDIREKGLFITKKENVTIDGGPEDVKDVTIYYPTHQILKVKIFKEEK